MSWQIILEPLAELDIDEAFMWYQEKYESLGHEFILSVRAIFERIKRNPDYATYQYEDIVKGVALKRFPFEVLYFIDDIKKEVHIIAVIHHSRSPLEWKRRIS